MNRFAFRFVFAAALVLTAADALAETAPRLKELVAISSEVVRIGDLVDGAGSAADVPVFRAPDLGRTGAVTTERVAEALRRNGVETIETGGLSAVIVTRLSRAFSAKDITDRIAKAIAGRAGFGAAESLSILLDRDVRPLHVEADASGELSATRISVQPHTGRFDVSFELPGSAAARRLPLRFTGSISETVELPTLGRALRAGEVLKASDVVIERRPKADAARGEAITADAAIGLAARVPLRAGQVLRAGDLVKPQAVQRNEAVTIVYDVPGISLTARGKAIEAGAVGDIVSVLNVQSNRTVQGTVAAPGRITVAPAGLPFNTAAVAAVATQTP